MTITDAASDGSDFHAADVHGFARRAFLRSSGVGAEAVRRRPVVGIATSHSDLNPCNAGGPVLVEAIRRGVAAAGGIAYAFPTISLGEAFVQPTTLYLRNLMSMDVEEMIRASPVDAVVLVAGCDKTVPAQIMGALSAGKPFLMVTSGPRRTGCWEGKPVVISDMWRVDEQRRAGELSEERWQDFESALNTNAGVCNVMGTAISMAAVAEALGVALPGSTFVESADSRRAEIAERTGSRIVEACRAGEQVGTTQTLPGLVNAFRVSLALGGSTNVPLHLEAIAGRVGIRLGFDLLQRVAAETPVLTRMQPGGPQTLADIEAGGGVPAVVRSLGGLFDLGQVCATGETWHQVTARLTESPAVMSADDPECVRGSLVFLRGTLAPAGALLKRVGADPRLLQHTGPALVFDDEADMLSRIDDPGLPVTPDTVLILRNVGPKGGPGMSETGRIPVPLRLLQQGVTDVVRISDARMSGTQAGTVVLHVAPESAAGGPLALVRTGDLVTLDASAGTLDLLVDDHELASRVAAAPNRRPGRGYAKLWHDSVLQSDEGCDFDFLRSETVPAAAAGTTP